MIAPRRVGFVGLGAMGMPMAMRLAGLPDTQLIVHDIAPATVQRALATPGVAAAAGLEAMCEACEVVMVCVPNNAALSDVVQCMQRLASGAALKTVINLGTTGSIVSKQMTGALHSRSIAYLDAPVSGGTPNAQAGTLAVMVSGARMQFERVKTVLDRLGTTVEFVGAEPGSAQTLKLINNLLSTTAFLVTGEALVMGVKAGLDPETMLRVINAGSGRNSATVDKFPRAVLDRSFNSGSLVDNTAKDTMLCLQEAADLGVPMWIGSAVRQFYEYALAQGAAGKDRSTLVQLIEDLAGVHIPKTR